MKWICTICGATRQHPTFIIAHVASAHNGQTGLACELTTLMKTLDMTLLSDISRFIRVEPEADEAEE